MTEIPYPLCALDLDDTLLGPDHFISARNAHAVRAVAALGTTVVLASGRMHEAMLPFTEILGLTSPILSYNGALIKLPDTGEEWQHKRVRPDLASQIMDFCSEHRLQLNFYWQGKVYSTAETPWLKLYHGRTGSPFEIKPDLYTAFREIAPTKLLIIDTPEYTDSLLAPFQQRFGSQLYITKTSDEYLEFMPPGVNKGEALAVIASRLGLRREQTLAIGDSFNDIPMLHWAGQGLAVANARPEVIAAADQTIGRYDEDGVGVALERIYRL